MASTGLQLVGFILGVLSWVGMIATCASPEWRKNSHGQTLIDNTIRYDGLWVRCKAFATGQTHCDDYNTFFIGLPGVLQVCRALMIASIGIGFIAILITIVGIKCTSIGSKNQRAKARVAMVGGLLFGVAAILSGASVSYYAHGVVQEYYNPVLEDDMPMHLRFEYGSALFVGWAGLVIGILGGVILCFTSVFIIMRQNMAEQRERLHPGTNAWSHHQGHSHHVSQQKQRYLPLMQQQKNPQIRLVRTHDEAALTKQRVAQHNAKLDTKTKHVHHAPVIISPKKQTEVDGSRSSSDKSKRYSGDGVNRPLSGDQAGASRRHHHHHHHMHSSKSEPSFQKRSTKTDEEDERRMNEGDNTNGFTRTRPAKEYV